MGGDWREKILSNEGFVRLALSHKNIINPFLQETKIHHSCSTFASIFMWDTYEQYWWKIEDDQLLVIANQESPFLPLLPRGQGDTEKAIYKCKKLMFWLNSRLLNIDCLDELERDYCSDFNIHESYGDYVYETQNIIELKGKDYSSRRGSRNSFLRNNSQIHYLKYDLSQYDCCVELLKKWQMHSDIKCGSDILNKRLAENICVIRVLEEAENLGLIGMTLYVNNQLIGFTFGEMLTTDTCSILIEKTDRNYKGSAEFLWSEYLKQHWYHTKLCNAGDDWGIPSLAWTKNSYHPISMISKWKANCEI